MERFILAHHKSPGDVVCLTSLVRDLHLQYPGRFELDVDTTCGDIWRHNPHLTKLYNRGKDKTPFHPGTQFLKMTYGDGIRQQKKETIHFAAYFHRNFTKQTGIQIQCQLPYGDMHLSEAEKANRPIKDRYWLMMAGGKSDFTIKVWHKQYFQDVVNMLNAEGIGVVQSGNNKRGDWHHKLDGVLDLVGKDSMRDWIRLIYHSDGVICGNTGAMHIAAALQRPCVVINGGREAWWWAAYVNENTGFGTKASGQLNVPHRFLHTIGLLDCCQRYGCWRNKVKNLPGGNDKLICKMPLQTPDMPIATCMAMITPKHVMDAVLSYYYDGTLPPLTSDTT